MSKCSHCGHYIDDRPKGDFPNAPTDEEFEAHHAAPQSYGDEDDWLLISKKYTAKEAADKLNQYMSDNWGWVEGDGIYPVKPDDLRTFDVGYGYDYDSYHYSEGSYWICSGESAITPRWQAWGVETQ